MKTKLKDAVLSILKEKGFDERDVVFLFDKNHEKDVVLWGFGIKGLTHIGSYQMNKIHSALRDYVDKNDISYQGIADYTTPMYTFKYGYGIIFSEALLSAWNFHMKDQEKEWREFKFYKEAPSGNFFKFLSRSFCWNKHPLK